MVNVMNVHRLSGTAWLEDFAVRSLGEEIVAELGVFTVLLCAFLADCA